MEQGSRFGQDILPAELVPRVAPDYNEKMKWSLLLALLFWPVPAPAMNWEGHDDWMEDHPAAVALEQDMNEARPLPPAPCKATPSVVDNPYEQVPLHQVPCTAPSVPRH